MREQDQSIEFHTARRTESGQRSGDSFQIGMRPHQLSDQLQCTQSSPDRSRWRKTFKADVNNLLLREMRRAAPRQRESGEGDGQLIRSTMKTADRAYVPLKTLRWRRNGFLSIITLKICDDLLGMIWLTFHFRIW